jgi:hypothetical protein
MGHCQRQVKAEFNVFRHCWHELLILKPAVTALKTRNCLEPGAAGYDVADSDDGCGFICSNPFHRAVDDVNTAPASTNYLRHLLSAQASHTSTDTPSSPSHPGRIPLDPIKIRASNKMPMARRADADSTDDRQVGSNAVPTVDQSAITHSAEDQYLRALNELRQQPALCSLLQTYKSA